MSELMAHIAALEAQSPPVTEAHDTSTPAFADYVDRVDEWVSSGGIWTAAEVAATVRRELPAALGLLVALKVAESRERLRAIPEPVTITLLSPVYKETGRMQRRDEHPHGEDSIRYKAAALDRITRFNPLIATQLIVIDDSCPDRSGAAAAEILDGLDGWADRHEVLFLEEARQGGDPDVPAGLTAKDGDRRSVKGGAVLFGMRRALRHEPPGRHVIVDSDADLSVLPDQLRLVVWPIVADGMSVVAGSRRESDAVALIGGSRGVRGSLFIGIWQYLLPQLATRITDANRAFKAFDADALRSIIDDVQVYTFPYQIEVLQAALARGVPLAPQGIAYVDSEAASTQQGESITETYLAQIRQVIDIARRWQTVDADDPLLEFFDDLDDRSWQAMEQDPPRRLLEILGL